MDEIDLAILAQLQQDGRKAYTEIAKALGIAEGTVRKRANRLIDNGTIKMVGIVDTLKLGHEPPVLIHVNVEPDSLDDAAKAIAAFDEVRYLLMVSGEYDLMVEVRCRDRQHFADFVRHKIGKVVGVRQIVSAMVMHTYKQEEVSVAL